MDARDEKQRRDTDALEWTLHPWLLSRFLTLLTPLPAPATLANLSAPVDTAYEWAHSCHLMAHLSSFRQDSAESDRVRPRHLFTS